MPVDKITNHTIEKKSDEELCRMKDLKSNTANDKVREVYSYIFDNEQIDSDFWFCGGYSFLEILLSRFTQQD